MSRCAARPRRCVADLLSCRTMALSAAYRTLQDHILELYQGVDDRCMLYRVYADQPVARRSTPLASRDHVWKGPALCPVTSEVIESNTLNNTSNILSGALQP